MAKRKTRKPRRKKSDAYKVATSFPKQFEYIAGTKPVLLYAPHSAQYKQRNLVGTYGKPEFATDIIAEQAAGELDGHSLTLKETVAFNPELAGTRIERDIAALLGVEKIKYFIEIHGHGATFSHDVVLSTVPQRRKSLNMARNLAGALSKAISGISILYAHIDESNGTTICENLTNKFSTHALRVSISEDLRSNPQWRQVVIDVLSEWLSAYN